MKKQLNLYRVDKKYIRDLHNVDDRVLSVSPQINKERRAFVGVVVTCNNYNYVIPLTHPKEKYFKIKPKLDFEPIWNGNKMIGVLRFNLMIPVEENIIYKLDLKIKATDSYENRAYKNLCINELSWCRKKENTEKIINKANVLYNLYLSGQEFKARSRCLNFPKLEKVCDKYKHKNDS